MLSDITIGQFFPGNSPLHRMDPRVKLVVIFAYIVLIFVPQNWAGLGVCVAYLLAGLLISGLPARLLLRSIKPIVPLIVLTTVLNVFYISGGETLVKWNFIHITTGGVNNAIFIAVRIVALIMGSSLLTYTTSPTTLTDALERLMSPLKVLRINVHEISMMMTIALRFIPTLIEETDKIMAAQKARGADLESGGLVQRVKALVPVLIPLFVSAFRRACDLATAMECRCYHGGDGRTRMKQMKMRRSDGVFLASTVLLCAVVILLNILLASSLA
ncbi:MAG: energy-coupling factor transporter transmembrane protein EcfT [Clostridia bacterium]|nr:energy-coupling factor transporter transmembrane protein EcfT [Clostridia bacterium]